MNIYKPKREVKTIRTSIRGLQYALHTWGSPDARPLFLLHGWADTGLSFQFLADYLADDYYLIAPDWRGFGETEWSQQGYWFPDYLADLDEILDYFSISTGLAVLGHSMGGNVACLYAGIRPERVSKLISLDVFGLPDKSPAEAPERYLSWLDQLSEEPVFSEYADLQELATHISKLAPAIGAPESLFVAHNWSKQKANGNFTVKTDPSHKRVNPVLYRREEAISCWKNVKADALFVFGAKSRIWKSYKEGNYQKEINAAFTNLQEELISNSGHMLHLEQPEILSKLVGEFLVN